MGIWLVILIEAVRYGVPALKSRYATTEQVPLRVEPTPATAPKIESASLLELAFTVLLVDLALVDNEFHDLEHRFIKTRLVDIFKISLDQAYALIEQADRIVAQNNDSDSYARYLAEVLSAESREKLVALLDELMRVDGRIDSFEVGLKQRYQRLLGVTV